MKTLLLVVTLFCLASCAELAKMAENKKAKSVETETGSETFQALTLDAVHVHGPDVSDFLDLDLTLAPRTMPPNPLRIGN